MSSTTGVGSTSVRDIPFLVKLQVLLGDFTAQFAMGWCVLFGSILLACLLEPVTDNLLFSGDLRTVQGVVVDNPKLSHVTESGQVSDASTNQVGRNYYKFELHSEEWKGTSWGNKLRVGQAITIEYKAGFPAVSRISGMTRYSTGGGQTGPIIVGCILGVGLIVWIPSLRRQLRGYHLLKAGVLTQGAFRETWATDELANDRATVYRMVFTYRTDDDQEYETELRTTRPPHLNQGDQLPLLYDPSRPSYSMLLGELSGSPVIDESDRVQDTSFAKSWPHFAVPAAALLWSIHVVKEMIVR